MDDGVLFQRVLDLCPGVVPGTQYEKTIIDVVMTERGEVGRVGVYGDVELGDGESACQALYTLINDAYLPDVCVQVVVYWNRATHTIITERSYNGTISEIALTYILIKSTNHTPIYLNTNADTSLYISAPCKIVRASDFFAIQPDHLWSTSTIAELRPAESSIFNEPVDISTIDVESYPLTCGSHRLPILSLQNISRYNGIQRELVKKLVGKYTHWRRIRGDGDCYYRAVAVSFLEYLCRRTTGVGELSQFVQGLQHQNIAYVIPGFESQYKYFLRRISELATAKSTFQDAFAMLQNCLQEAKFDQSAAAVFRCISYYSFEELLDKNPDFSNFLDNSIENYLELMTTKGKEAEGVIYRAMAHGLGVDIDHVTLDALQCREDRYEGGGKKEVVLSLLYKPGHYDVLYSMKVQAVDQYIYATNSFTDPPVDIPPTFLEHLNRSQ